MAQAARFLKLSFFSIAVLWAVLLLPGRAFTDEFGTLLPDNPYVFVGENLTLVCRLNTTRMKGEAQDLFFTHGSQEVDSRYVQVDNGSAARLNYPITTIEQNVHFVCKLRQPDFPSGFFLASQHVLVDYAPAPVRNVTCVVHAWQEMSCSWDLGQVYKYPNNISVRPSLRINASRKGKVCRPTQQNMTWALWTKDSNCYMWGNWYKLQVRVKNTKRKNSSKTLRQTIKTRHIVKPPKVAKLQEYNRTTDSICVRAHHADYVHNKLIFVQYASQWNPEKWIELNATAFKRSPAEVTLQGLRPFTVYTIRVAVGPGGNDKGFLSDWVPLSVQTLPSVPKVAPQMCSGCYTIMSCNEILSCHVRLYWKAIPMALRDSQLKDYCLDITTLPAEWTADLRSLTTQTRNWTSQDRDSTGQQGEVSSEQSKSMRPQGPGNATSHLLLLSALNDSLVRLYALTSQDRLSPNFSHVIIPSLQHRPVGPKSLVVETDLPWMNGSWSGQFFLRWSEPTEDGDPTVSFLAVWCRGSMMMCQDEENLQWLEVASNQTQVTVSITDQHKQGYNANHFIVGAARQVRYQQDQVISSGIFWAPCVHYRHAAPRVAPEIIAISQAESGGLHVTWNYKSCGNEEGDVYATHFIIYYCLTSDLDTNSCRGREENVTVVGELSSWVVEGLEAGRSYTVSMAAHSLWGLGPRSSSRTYTLLDTQESTDGGIYFALVGAGVIMLLVIIVTVCKLKTPKSDAHRRPRTGRSVERSAGKYKKADRKFASSIDNEAYTQFVGTNAKRGRAADLVFDSTTYFSKNGVTTNRMPDMQDSVTSQTPLLRQDGGRGEDGAGYQHQHHQQQQQTEDDVLHSVKLQDSQKSGLLQGVDSGVECHSSGSLESEDSARSAKQSAAQGQLPSTETSTGHGARSVIRTGYVPTDVEPAGLGLNPHLLLSQEREKPCMTRSGSVTDGEEPSPQSQLEFCAESANQMQRTCDTTDGAVPAILCPGNLQLEDHYVMTAQPCIPTSEPLSQVARLTSQNPVYMRRDDSVNVSSVTGLSFPAEESLRGLGMLNGSEESLSDTLSVSSQDCVAGSLTGIQDEASTGVSSVRRDAETSQTSASPYVPHTPVHNAFTASEHSAPDIPVSSAVSKDACLNQTPISFGLDAYIAGIPHASFEDSDDDMPTSYVIDVPDASFEVSLKDCGGACVSLASSSSLLPTSPPPSLSTNVITPEVNHKQTEVMQSSPEQPASVGAGESTVSWPATPTSSYDWAAILTTDDSENSKSDAEISLNDSDPDDCPPLHLSIGLYHSAGSYSPVPVVPETRAPGGYVCRPVQ